MNAGRIRTIVRLELTQRLRSVGWYVLLGIFAVILLVVTGLAIAASALTAGSGGWLFSALILLVLLLVLLVTPTLSGNSVNGDREAATLAPLQVTLATAGDIVIGKLLAAWIAGLAFLIVAAPFLVVATLAGGLGAGAIATSLGVLVLEVGIVAAIGVGLSAIVARPLFSVAATYLVIAALTVGTLIAFGLGTITSRAEVTVSERSYDGTACGDWQTYTYETPRTDHVWWLLSANPFVVLADATPITYNQYGSPENLFGQISYGVRSAQIPPDTDVRYDYCDTASWETTPEDLQERVAGTAPSWFVGLLLQLVLAGGLLAWGWARTRTPSRTLPPGTRIA
ncbi:ABC transporter permease [Microbacterium sp. 10M-3C3]|jgi:ABC-type transport system involved in multi-copper enzyme maturation permease subunit|uniref:ABC transporter permease n=1 Tax=Microbacterium sp. 10M-3C3 TaxID=2483401 RepID=UPI000F63B4F5|nr:ABC transporter permease [Microbacterium sp. 10M-3C3]